MKKYETFQKSQIQRQQKQKYGINGFLLLIELNVYSIKCQT